MSIAVSPPTAALGGVRKKVALNKVFTWVIVAIVAAVIICAVIGPWIAPSNITSSNINQALQGPSAAHWFGTDDQGRDVFWRIVAGARYSVLSAMLIVACYSLIGTAIAAIASVGGKVVDEVLMRFTDAAMSIPTVIIGMGFAAALGPSLKSAIVALSLTGWPVTARLLRGVIRETVAMPYVDGARVLGVPTRRLLLRHILPNSLDVLVVKWAADIGSTILVISSLSFIGVGPQPPNPEWGAMVTEGQTYISTAWWATVWPGVAIAVATMAFALLGDIAQTRMSRGARRS